MNSPPPRSNPCNVELVFHDFKGRHTAIVKALTTDVVKFYFHCDPEKDNLCLFGYPDEHWEVTYPAKDLPPEFPEPTLGINFCRNGMRERDWLRFVAAHCDAWLLSVAFYFGARLDFDSTDRNRLFTMINELPTVSEMVTGTTRRQAMAKPSVSTGNKSKSGSRGRGRPASRKNSKKVTDEDEDEDADEGFKEEEYEEDGETLCGACGQAYATSEFWICCDKCEKWFHGKCVKVTPARADHMKQYKCPSCSRKRGRHNSS